MKAPVEAVNKKPDALSNLVLITMINIVLMVTAQQKHLR